jgi:amidase
LNLSRFDEIVPFMGADDPFDRRDLLRLSALAGLTAVAGSTLAGCQPRATPTLGNHGAAPSPSELDELTIAELQRRMAAGSESAVSLLGKYRARIATVNETGPNLRAVIELA